MAEWTLTSDSPEATRGHAQALAANLQPGDVVALAGPLGAGKTQFVKGLAAGLGVADPRGVNSPTFTLIQEYHGRITLYHLDAYRLASARELDALGFDELLDAGGIVVVEWADRVTPLMPDQTIWINLTPTGERTRSLTIRAPSASADRLRKR